MALWATAPLHLSKDLTVFHNISTHMWVLQYLAGLSPPTTPQSRHKEGKEPGRGEVRSGSGEVGFESTRLHIICILSCLPACQMLSVDLFLGPSQWGPVLFSHRHVSGGWAS